MEIRGTSTSLSEGTIDRSESHGHHRVQDRNGQRYCCVMFPEMAYAIAERDSTPSCLLEAVHVTDDESLHGF